MFKKQEMTLEWKDLGKLQYSGEIELVPGEGAECVADTQAGAKGTPNEGGLWPEGWHEM